MSSNSPPPNSPYPGASPQWSPQAGPGVAANKKDKPKVALIVGVVLLLLSLGGCGYGCATFISAATDLANKFDTSERHPAGSVVGVDNATGWVLIFGDQNLSCEVQDENGRAINQSIDADVSSAANQQAGDGIAVLGGFEAQSNKSYEISCDSPSQDGRGEFRVIDIPGLATAQQALLSVVGGFILFVIGLIVLIVGLVQRSRWKKNQRPMGGYPGGPGGPGGYAGPPTGYGAPTPPPAPGGFGAPNPPPAPGGYGSPTPPPPPPTGFGSPPPPPAPPGGHVGPPPPGGYPGTGENPAQ